MDICSVFVMYSKLVDMYFSEYVLMYVQTTLKHKVKHFTELYFKPYFNHIKFYVWKNDMSAIFKTIFYNFKNAMLQS